MRVEMFAEQLEIVHRLWTEDRVDFRGRHYDLEDAPGLPKPVQKPHPPILVGGSGLRGTADPAARFADEYNSPFVSPDDFAAIRAKVVAACERAGRDPATMRFSTMCGCLIGATQADALERARELYGRVPRDADFDTWLEGYSNRVARRLRRRGGRAAGRVRARGLRPRHAPAPPPRGSRAGAADRAGAGAGRRVTETGTTRMETFSDGVFAIAATLLVLEFSVGAYQGTNLGSALLHRWPSYLAYVTSFITIGIIWMNHHWCVGTMARVDRTLLFLNILLLMTVAFLPFPTKLVADYLQKPGEQAAVLAYDATFVVMAVLYNLWWRYASRGRRLIADDVPDSRIRAINRAFDPGVPMYLACFVVAIFSPLASVALTFAIAAFYLPSAALFERGEAAA